MTKDELRLRRSIASVEKRLDEKYRRLSAARVRAEREFELSCYEKGLIYFPLYD